MLPTNHQVVAAGGLHVVGTERHESRRIDNQVKLKKIYVKQRIDMALV